MNALKTYIKTLKISKMQESTFNHDFLKYNEGKPDYKALHEIFVRKEPVTWLFAGDSITHGCMHTGYWCNFQEYFEKYIKNFSGRKADTVVNTGVSSAATKDMRERFNEWALNPDADVAFICFGMNDCMLEGMTTEIYRENLIFAVNELRKRGAVPILQTPNTSERQKNIEPYLAEVRRISKEENVLLIDVNRYFKENKKTAGYLLNDPIHPNAAGHLAWCRFLLKSLGLYSEKSPLGELSYREVSKPYAPGKIQPAVYPNEKAACEVSEYINNGKQAVWAFLGGETGAGFSLPLNARSFVYHFNEAVRWEKATDNLNYRSKTIINLCSPERDVSFIAENYGSLAGRFNPDVSVYLPDLKDIEREDFSENVIKLSEKASKRGGKLLLLIPYAVSDKEKYVLSELEKAGKIVLIDIAYLTDNSVSDKASPDFHFALARALTLSLTDLPKNSRMR